MNLVTAPVDWSRVMGRAARREYYGLVRRLIEEVSAANDNRPVMLVSHSLGSVLG